MATYTENYNLEKPAQSDLYNIDVFNENADKIDEALGDKAENQSLAPIESSATASRNYSVGQQFVYNGLLYEATSAIASGGTITPGSNCARTTVAEELKSLNDSLNNKIYGFYGFEKTVLISNTTTVPSGDFELQMTFEHELSRTPSNVIVFMKQTYLQFISITNSMSKTGCGVRFHNNGTSFAVQGMRLDCLVVFN